MTNSKTPLILIESGGYLLALVVGDGRGAQLMLLDPLWDDFPRSVSATAETGSSPTGHGSPRRLPTSDASRTGSHRVLCSEAGLVESTCLTSPRSRFEAS
jgi:hypothetical protein